MTPLRVLTYSILGLVVVLSTFITGVGQVQVFSQTTNASNVTLSVSDLNGTELSAMSEVLANATMHIIVKDDNGTEILAFAQRCPGGLVIHFDGPRCHQA
jgi:hypothetical protein